MMVTRAPPAVAPPPVLRPDWKTLIRLASTRSKLLDLDACPTLSSSSVSFMVQPINRSPLGFDAHTKKPSWWFWGPNHPTVAAGFEDQIRKPITTSFEAKTGETIPVVLTSNHRQTVLVVLRQNHWQTADLSFEAQPRNTCSSSPRARYRPHTILPDLSIAQPLSIRPVPPCLVLCTRSPTLVMILVTARHATAGTWTPQDKQTRFSTRNKDTGKTTELSRIRIQTSVSQWLITIKLRNWTLEWIEYKKHKVWI
jgi:hypothetical protein